MSFKTNILTRDKVRNKTELAKSFIQEGDCLARKGRGNFRCSRREDRILGSDCRRFRFNFFWCFYGWWPTLLLVPGCQCKSLHGWTSFSIWLVLHILGRFSHLVSTGVLSTGDVDSSVALHSWCERLHETEFSNGKYVIVLNNLFLR